MPSGDPARFRSPRQLPPGRHGFPPGYVERNQRRRIMRAVAEVCAAIGVADASVERIIGHAAVSRRTFYEHFRNRQDAFLAAYDEAIGRAEDAVAAAVDRAGSFPERASAGLGALLRFLADEPALARMCIVEVLAAGPEAIERRSATMRGFAILIHADARARVRESASLLTAETIVGGIYEVVHTRVLRGETTELPKLLPDLAFSLLLPYVGQQAALEQRRRLLRAG